VTSPTLRKLVGKSRGFPVACRLRRWPSSQVGQASGWPARGGVTRAGGSSMVSKPSEGKARGVAELWGTSPVGKAPKRGKPRGTKARGREPRWVKTWGGSPGEMNLRSATPWILGGCPVRGRRMKNETDRHDAESWRTPNNCEQQINNTNSSRIRPYSWLSVHKLSALNWNYSFCLVINVHYVNIALTAQDL
jgi:hypothetical protein